MTIASAESSGGSEWTITGLPTPGTIVAPGSQISIEVTFLPAASDIYSASISFATDSPKSGGALWIQLVGHTTDRVPVVAVAAGGADNVIALRKDGKVRVWGYAAESYFGQMPADLSNVIAVSTGYLHVLALKSDKTVVAFGGDDFWHQISHKPLVNTIVAIASGYDHSLVLHEDATITLWGGNRYGQLDATAVTDVALSGMGPLINGGLPESGGCVAEPHVTIVPSSFSTTT